MQIPLPKLMRHWREKEFERALAPATQRYGLRLYAFLARRPSLYRLATRIAAASLAAMSGRRGRLATLPLAGGWTKHRDMPAPEGGTFMAAYRRDNPGREGARR
jgi:L-lactate dehydrogenase complex protein LldF